MGRNIEIDARRGTGAPHEILFGEVTIEATELRHDGTKTVFPDATTVGISNGLATLENADSSPAGPEPAWAYKVTFRNTQTGRGWSEIVGIPTGTTPVSYAILPRFLGPDVIPPETTKADLQNWVATTEAAKNTAVQAAATATAPTDAMVAGKINDPASLTGTALSAAIGESLEPVREAAAVIDGLVSALDMRDPRPLVVAQASDSTGDSFREWFEVAFKEMMASRWKERGARVYTWNKGTDTYDGPVSWQTGETPASSSVVTVGKDTFTTDSASLSGRASESGGVWEVGTGGGTWSVGGGKLLQTTAIPSDGVRLPLSVHNSHDGTYTGVFTMASTGATQTLVIDIKATTPTSAADRLHVIIGGTNSMTSTLRKNIGGVETTIATWPAGTINVTGGPVTFTLTVTVAGLAITATLNGATVNATLDAGDVVAIGKGYTRLAINQSALTTVDSIEITGTITIAAQPSELGTLTAYNAGYAGGRAEHQLVRLDGMFPIRPDVLFVNHGHNYSVAGQDTPEFFTNALDEFVNAFHVKWPGVPVVCLSQNPEHALPGSTRTAQQVAAHTARQVALRAHCRRRGWGYIPTFEAFMAEPDKGYARINADGVHPLVVDLVPEPTGSRLQIDVAKAWITSQSLRP